MAYQGKRCPMCGANLDPGERCDCETIEPKPVDPISAQPAKEAK